MFLHFPLLKTPPPRWRVQNTPWELFEYLLSTSTSLNAPVSERHRYLGFFIMAGAITWSTTSLDMPEPATTMYTLCPTNGLPMCAGSRATSLDMRLPATTMKTLRPTDWPSHAPTISRRMGRCGGIFGAEGGVARHCVLGFVKDAEEGCLGCVGG